MMLTNENLNMLVDRDPLDINSVASRYGVDKRTIYRWHSQGTFPDPIGKTNRWSMLAIVKFEAGDSLKC